jgi:hypothetical protein
LGSCLSKTPCYVNTQYTRLSVELNQKIKTPNFSMNLTSSPLKVTLYLLITQLIFSCDLRESEVLPLPLHDDIKTFSTAIQDCSTCTYVVPDRTHVIDGLALGLKPGAVICLNAATPYKNLLFRNITGTAEQPITITNCGGTATLTATGLSFGLKTQNSKYFRITGGTTANTYGIKIVNGHIGIALGDLSTNFEVDHVEVAGSGFAGIMAKTDPTCDPATARENFTMKNVSLNYNYVHDCGGEGFYVGNSFFQAGVNTDCGIRYPHEIHYLRLYSNIVKNSGWDGIQVGCATVGAKIYGNTIENYGTLNRYSQRNGMQLGEGTGGLCYGNFIKHGTGNGMNILGLGTNVIYNNVIVDAGDMGIFCDERYTTGSGFKFINNTIINPKSDGIRLYADLVPLNVIVNNIIVNPGNYSKYVYPRTPEDAFLYKLSKTVRVDLRNNFFTTSIEDVQFNNPALDNYRLALTSQLVDKGADITTYAIGTDFYKKSRLRGMAFDIGAAELQ